MREYSFLQWLSFFYLYSIVGWIWESTYDSIKDRRFVNRGFMKGPVIPIYGSGAIVMLIAAAPFENNYILTFLSGTILATILEYCTGAAMEAIFKVKYWDYSKLKFNLNGHICLFVSIGWGFATILVNNFLHKPVENFVCGIPYDVLYVVVLLFTIAFVADFALSFKAAIDLRNLLIKLDSIKDEVARMQKRMDVLLAVANDEKNHSTQLVHEKIEDMQERIEDVHERIEDKLTIIENKIIVAKEKLDLSDELRDELAEFKAKSALLKERVSQLSNVKDILRQMTIKGNPHLSSVKFKDSLEELKTYINQK